MAGERLRRWETARSTPREAPCFLCGGALDDGADVRLRGFAICTACAAELSADDRSDEPTVHTPGAGTVLCARCGRSMPGPGSYRLVDEEPRCPACAPLHAEDADTISPADPDTTCAACQRTLPRGELRTARGFRLCAACLDSDPVLALALARARHRRALQHLGQRLLGGAGHDDE